MGTFAELYTGKDAAIPEEKREEFARRVETVFRAGGMMKVNSISLFDKHVPVISIAEMREDGMNVNYNYFEEAFWENAGFDKRTGHVWSNKIGWDKFHDAVVAAYVLEEMYTDGVAVAEVNGEPVLYWRYMAWLNYLFHEKKHIKNFDKWKLFESYHDEEDYNGTEMDWEDFSCDRYGFISACEIYAVIYGTSKLFQYVDKENKSERQRLALTAMEHTAGCMTEYREKSTLDKEEQCGELMKLLADYYEKGVRTNPDKLLERIMTNVSVSDAPAFAVKLIAELYEKDFWELWSKIRFSAGRRFEEMYGNEGYYVLPVSTSEMFGQTPDDMIPYWEEDGDITFSEELSEWLKELKSRFDLIAAKEAKEKMSLRKVLELMEYAHERYYFIFTFEDFFEETAEHLSDVRYQALWQLYEELLMDEQLQKEGSIIFNPTGQKRCLKGSWDFMNKDEKNNRARVTLRRYMALVANKPLRKIVFGF